MSSKRILMRDRAYLFILVLSFFLFITSSWVLAIPLTQEELKATKQPIDSGVYTCINKSILNPQPALWVNECPWVDTALKKAGFNTPEWNFRYSDPTTNTDFALESKLEITNYYAWVVDQPTISIDGLEAGGERYGDYGGAAFSLKYSPKGNDPTTNIHWLQVIDQTRGSCHSTLLDAPLNTVPWYDVGYAAGKHWFVDIPAEPCVTCCSWFADVDFQVFLAVDNYDSTSGIHYVDLYEGIQWGFEYWCTPVPEPTTILLLVSGLIGLAGFRKKLRENSTSCEKLK